MSYGITENCLFVYEIIGNQLLNLEYTSMLKYTLLEPNGLEPVRRDVVILLNQWGFLVDRTHGNKLRLKLNQNEAIFFLKRIAWMCRAMLARTSRRQGHVST